jgi:hypothetical protein
MSKPTPAATKIEDQQSDLGNSAVKKPWQEPKLTFIKPRLTDHGKLEEVTGQFFGQFSPGRTAIP